MAILITLGILVVSIVLSYNVHPLFGFVIWLGTTIWAGVDAGKIELEKYRVNGVTTSTNTVLGCLFLWIIAFPWYLINKGKIARGEVELKKGCTVTRKESPTSQVGCQSQSDTLEQLEKLAQLKEKGFLTEDEFQAQKAKLLAK